MDFHLTREQDLVRRMMKDFTENEVKPIAAETDLHLPPRKHR